MIVTRPMYLSCLAYRVIVKTRHVVHELSVNSLPLMPLLLTRFSEHPLPHSLTVPHSLTALSFFTDFFCFMWMIFKVFTEFVTILLLVFVCLFFFLSSGFLASRHVGS